MGLVKNELHSNTLKWLDGTLVNIIELYDNEPNTSGICVWRKRKEYTDNACTNSILFICEMSMYFILVYSYSGVEWQSLFLSSSDNTIEKESCQAVKP